LEEIAFENFNISENNLFNVELAKIQGYLEGAIFAQISFLDA
jgi:hypothetical protein